MRNALIILGIMPFTLAFSQSTKTDTIYVNSTTIVHILFNDEIDNGPDTKPKVGAPSLYDAFASRNQLDIKSKIPNDKNKRFPPITTLMVRFKDSEEYYHSIIKYSKNPKVFLVDKRDPEYTKKKAEKARVEKMAAEEKEANPSAIQVDYSVIKKRKNMVLEEKERLDKISIYKHNMLVHVPNIKNDDKFTYIKLSVRNKSSVDYVVDVVTFEIKEKLKKSVAKNHNIENEIKESPEIETRFDKISAYDEKSVVYALPIFATGNGSNNFLLVTLREKNGTRKIDLEIPIKYFVKAELF